MSLRYPGVADAVSGGMADVEIFYPDIPYHAGLKNTAGPEYFSCEQGDNHTVMAGSGRPTIPGNENQLLRQCRMCGLCGNFRIHLYGYKIGGSSLGTALCPGLPCSDWDDNIHKNLEIYDCTGKKVIFMHPYLPNPS